jgi:peptide/nickel transport system permease protein
MLTVIRDLLRHDGRFRVAFLFLLFTFILAALSFVSPYSPGKTFLVPQDMAPSLQHPFGTNSRGQDLLWWMAFAVRNSIVLGLIAALVSRVIALSVGLTAGYRGSTSDRLLMSINDSFVVLPVLPILILLSFLLQGKLSLVSLGILLGLFGWPWDARLFRAQVLSLKERSFTRTAVYSGTNPVLISSREHLPFVMPIVLATWRPRLTTCFGRSGWR